MPPLPALNAAGLGALERVDPECPVWAHALRQSQPYANTFALNGSAQAGHARLHWFVWESQCIQRYKETRNDPLAVDVSSKFSPWLAHGGLSAREVWAEVVRFEAAHRANASTYWLRFEVLWREYFFGYARHHGAAIFALRGPERVAPGRQRTAAGVGASVGGRNERVDSVGSETTWMGRLLNGLAAHKRVAFETWTRGETEAPFVNAALRELRESGWLSNRSRRNCSGGHFTRMPPGLRE